MPKHIQASGGAMPSHQRSRHRAAPNMTAAPNGAAALARDLFAFTVLVVFVVGVAVVLPDLSAAIHQGGPVLVAERWEG